MGLFGSAGFLLGAALFAALAERGTGLGFALNGRSTECILLRPPAGTEVEGWYETLPSTARNVGARVTHAGKTVLHVTESRSGWKFTSEATASEAEPETPDALPRYELCFLNGESYPVIMSFGYRDAAAPSTDVATGSDAEAILSLLQNIRNSLTHLRYQQAFAIRGEAVHRETAAKTERAVISWAVIKVLTACVFGGAQTWYLRSLFEVKTVV